MSTPMETNTEQLREILQQVYDLPEAGNGGGSEPDLAICPMLDDGTSNYFRMKAGNFNGRDCGPKYVTYDPEKVISVYEKLQAGKDVRVVFTGLLSLNSWDGYFSVCYPCSRAVAISNPNYTLLAVAFQMDAWFDDAIMDTPVPLEVDFHIDLENRIVTEVHGRTHKA